MWLTDISFLFMLNDGEERRFKYAGANKGDLTMTFLFSNWGSGTRAVDGTYAFSGGQFDGTYNNESRYQRQLNFTVPSYATSVEIVATITGHGFNQDTANCAEFCDHEHHYTMGTHTAYEWHPIVYDREGCENEVRNGVVANQFGSWPFGRAGWCAGQDVKQWTYNITDWVDNSANNTNHLEYGATTAKNTCHPMVSETVDETFVPWCGLSYEPTLMAGGGAARSTRFGTTCSVSKWS